METSLMSLTSGNQRLLEILGLLTKIHPWDHSSSNISELRKSSKTSSSWHRKILVKPWNTEVRHLWVISKSRQNRVEVRASQQTGEVWLQLWIWFWHLSKSSSRWSLIQLCHQVIGKPEPTKSWVLPNWRNS